MEGVTQGVAHLTIHIAPPNFTMCATSTSHHPGAHPGMARGSCAIRASKWAVRRLGIIGHMWRELLAPWLTLQCPPIPATPRRKLEHKGGGGAPSGRARGCRRICEPRWCSQRLVIQDTMWRELPRGWPTLQSTLHPPTSRCVPPRLHTTQAHIPGWHVVPARSVQASGPLDV